MVRRPALNVAVAPKACEAHVMESQDATGLVVAIEDADLVDLEVPQVLTDLVDLTDLTDLVAACRIQVGSSTTRCSTMPTTTGCLAATN